MPMSVIESVALQQLAKGAWKMLILTRRTGEALIIGDDIEVTVLSVDGNQVKIGIDAPDDVAVHREEVYHRIREEEVA